MSRRKQPQRKRRTREHVIADLSINHVERHVLLCGYTLERIVRDYGLDLFLATYNVNGELESGYVLLQLKATDHLKTVSSGQSIAHRIERGDVRAWLEQTMPVILVIYDAQADIAYRLYIQAYFGNLTKFNPRKGSDRFTVHIPRSNVLNQAAIRQLARFRDQILAQTALRIHHHE